MVDCIALVVHPERQGAEEHAMIAAEFFRSRGIHVFFPQKETLDHSFEQMLIMTFGGDGTLLIGAGFALRYHAPLLGINLGTVGFLTEGEPDQLPGIMAQLLKNDYELEERHLLQVHTDEADHAFIAVNDAVVTRGGFARLIRVEAYVNEEFLGVYTADGMIASTPTGSTGYALSAGGPVVAPGVACTVITPICPHSFQRQSFVVPDQATVRFHLLASRQQSAELQIDGQHRCMLTAGSNVWITGAKETLQLVRLRAPQFFTLSMKKLNEWSIHGERSDDH